MIGDIIAIMTPLLLASIGGLYTELTGVLNIALEGLMLIGAFFSIVVVAVSGNFLLGITAGVAASFLFACFFGYFALKFKANIFIAGLGINLLAGGVTSFFSLWIFGTKGVLRFQSVNPVPVVTIPFIHKIPILGSILSGHAVHVYISWLFVLASLYILYRSPFGLSVRCTGYDEKALRSRGRDPFTYKLAAIAISGIACGFAGSIVSLRIGAWVPNITAGRGWIALVAIYLGFKHPVGIFIACLVFAGAEYAANSLQGVHAFPASLALSLPYLLTVLAMIVTLTIKKLSKK